MDWRHVFALDPPGPAKPTDRQHQVVERLCREVVRRRLTTPALLLLEMSRPMNYVSAQFLHFLQPIIGTLTNVAEYDAFTVFLEQRGSVDYLVKRLEVIEADTAHGISRPHGSN
jgi:hypothetical protein